MHLDRLDVIVMRSNWQPLTQDPPPTPPEPERVSGGKIVFGILWGILATLGGAGIMAWSLMATLQKIPADPSGFFSAVGFGIFIVGVVRVSTSLWDIVTNCKIKKKR